MHPDVIAELVVLLKGAGIEGQFLSKLEEYLFNLKSYGNAAIGIITPRENAGFAERPHRGHNTSRA